MLNAERKPAAPAPTKTQKKKAECCTEHDCDSSLRNNYFEGKRLTAESFRVEQEYLLERRRLLNRAIHGWGVVHGYAVSPSKTVVRGEPAFLAVGAGLALDACGRELVETRARALGTDDVIWLDQEKRPVTQEEANAAGNWAGDGRQRCWLLSVHYAEERVHPADADASCGCGPREFDRTCETVRYSLRRVACADCCQDAPCEIDCECGRGPCCDPAREADPAGGEKARPPTRGGCGCLCGHLAGLELASGCGALCDVEERCAQVQVDLDHGVPLACLMVGYADRDPDTKDGGFRIETCGPRRLVKRNDLLYDLIRGCDLTRISDYGWKRWHRSLEHMSFEDLKRGFGATGKRAERVQTPGFWVEFSRPVRNETVLADCFAITILSGEHRERWWEPLRVPIVDVVLRARVGDDPEGHTRRADLVVDGRWLEDAVGGSSTIFDEHEARVEIQVRGDFIVDCNGLTVDMNAHGLSKLPRGNGAPGDTFLSTFTVAPAHERPGRQIPPREIPDDERPIGVRS